VKLLRVLGRKNASQKEIDTAINILKNTGSIDWAFRLAREKIEKAVGFLDGVPQSAPKKVLIDLGHFILKRKY
jgi:geranylgeranyl diphosphate synthase type I